jgi:hypothetical protein
VDRNRLVLAVSLVWSCLSGASSLAQPVEKVLNWTAPPYWMPIKAPAIDKRAEVGLAPEAVEAVPTDPLAFTGITPCRVADTRGNGFSGQYGPPQITPAGRTITIANVCGIPAAAEAVSFNFSAVNIPGAGFLVTYPAGGAFPATATMTYNQNTPNLSNAAVVPLGTAGAITVVAGVVPIDLVIDVNGYYAPQAAGNSEGWSLTGNAGTTPGPNFLGTIDNQALELKVNGMRALRLEPNPVPNVIGGASGNFVAAGALGATIGGGGALSIGQNRVTDHFGTVAGGLNNQAGNGSALVDDAEAATVCGGTDNTAGGFHAFVGGGGMNAAAGPISTVGGGNANIAEGFGANISGGQSNTASGNYSTIPGGFNNTAAGEFSLAAGTRARAMNSGSFVWGGNVDADISDGGANQFIVRAPGGVWLGTTSSPVIDEMDFLSTSTGAHLTLAGIWKNNSDRALKEHFESIDKRDLLERVAALPISKWKYKVEGANVHHVGPMAQDFAAAFGLGGDDRSISTLDADGVALAAVQALYEIVKEKDGEIADLKERLTRLESSRN